MFDFASPEGVKPLLKTQRRRTCVILSAGLILLAMSMPTFAQTHQNEEAWGGLLVGHLNIILHIKRSEAGQFEARVDSPDQGVFGIAADRAVKDNDEISFTLDSIGAQYSGSWNEERNAWVGTFRQGGNDLPLELTRLTAEEAKPKPIKRPQEEAIQAAPVPYGVEDVVFPGGASGVTLAGTLTMPTRGGDFPTLVLISGSGPQDRNEEIANHKPFLVLADFLTRKGFAVLRYDDRGVGKSTGNFAMATLTDFADDVASAVKYLKSRSEVDPGHIGLIGHSEGALIAPMVANSDQAVKFVVLLASSGIPGYDLLKAQAEAGMKAMGADEQTLAAALKQQEDLLSAYKSAKTWQEANQLFFARLDDTVENGEMPKSVADSYRNIQGAWMYDFVHYDPAPALAKLSIPVLTVTGSMDVQVPPEVNLAPVKSALRNNADAHVEVLPRLNHLFQTAQTGSVSEYGQIQETFSPAALELIGQWLQKTVSR